MAIPDKAFTRGEQYLAAMAGQSGTLPDEPITRKEFYLAKAAGQNVETPPPITREEMYLDVIAESGGGGGGSGWTPAVRAALLNLMEHVAYTDEHGQEYYDALVAALNGGSVPEVESISAVFNQGSAVIYDTDSLDTLKQHLTVTANYSDSTTETVTSYTLSGTLTEGTSTITVTYSGKTATFDVAVSSVSKTIQFLFDENKTIISMADGTASSNTSWVAMDYTSGISGYTKLKFTNNESSNVSFRGAFYDSNNSYVSSALASLWTVGTGKTGSIAIPATAVYIRLSTNFESFLNQEVAFVATNE